MADESNSSVVAIVAIVIIVLLVLGGYYVFMNREGGANTNVSVTAPAVGGGESAAPAAANP